MSADLLPLDSLFESGRVNRPPLREWSRLLLDQLRALPPGLAGAPGISTCMNNAGLIEVHRGDHRAAWALCELQLQWIARLVEQHGPMAAAHHALQPWINLGRLRRMQGQSERALQHFSLLADTREGRPVRLGPLWLDAASWQQLVQTHDLVPFMQAVCIIDGTKTFLARQDFEGALRFIAQVRVLLETGHVSELLDEAELQVLTRLGRYPEALEVTERPGWQRGSYGKLLRMSYRVALFSTLGERNAVRRMGEHLAEGVLKRDLDKPSDQRFSRYLLFLGGLLKRLELPGPCVRVLEAALRASQHLGDVPLRLSTLEALLETGGWVERERLSRERASLLEECLYVTLLKPRGLVVAPAASADPVFPRLHHALRAAAANWRGPWGVSSIAGGCQ